MVVGVLRIEAAVYEARSLKDKRRVVRSLKDRLASKYNVSVAEVDYLDSWQRAALGVALVTNETRFAHGCLDKIMDYVRAHRGLSVIDYEKIVY